MFTESVSQQVVSLTSEVRLWLDNNRFVFVSRYLINPNRSAPFVSPSSVSCDTDSELMDLEQQVEN